MRLVNFRSYSIINKKTEDFRMAEKRRKHLQYQLNSSFKTTTITSGSPYTVRVEKTQKDNQDKYKAWKERAQTAKTRLVSLAQEAPLVEVIGEQAYRGFLEHEIFQGPPPTAGSSANQQGPNSINPARAPDPVSSAASTAERPDGSGSSTIPQERVFIDLT
ncbi:hypothetical protein M432DRAFT_369532 [Thermoascus aurantiacus ATCC 26904]